MVLNGALFLLVCAAARAAASGGDGPLLNGNFENSPIRSQMNGTRVMGKYAIPYWKVTGFVEYIESGTKQDHMVLIVPEGRHAVRLGTESSVQQQLSVTRGKHYSITFSAARTCAQSEKLSVSIVPGDASGGELPIQTVLNGRPRARQARLQGRGEQHPGGVLQHGLPHGVRQQRHALRARRRRRLARLCFAPACSPVAPLMRRRMSWERAAGKWKMTAENDTSIVA